MPNFKSFVTVAANPAAAVYTVPSGKTAIVLSLQLTNHTANSAFCSIFLTRDSDQKYIAHLQVPAYSVSEVVQNKLILQEGDSLSVHSGLAASINLITSLTETP